MGRFSNLEFGRPAPFPEEEAGQVRDDSFYIKRATEALQSARFENALRYFSRALEFNPNLIAAWVGQVQMLIELGELKEARLWADKALEIHRDNAELLAAKAVVFAREGDTKRGIEFADAALSQKGMSPYVWIARGEALLAQGRPNDDHCFEKAIGLAKDDWYVAVWVARILYSYQHFAKALANVQKAVERETVKPFAWYVMGNCQLVLGLMGQAQRSYNQALSLDRDFEPAHKALVDIRNRGFFGRLMSRVRGFFRRRKG